MALFSRKTKVDAADFSRDFYDRYIFGPDPTGGDSSAGYAATVQCVIAESDSSFAAVPLPVLTEELRALQLEMIGTAWTHESKAEVVLEVSKLTKHYLSAINRSDLWDAMTDYNQAVAESATYGAGRDKTDLMNRTRFDLFESLIARESDADAAADTVARVANRVGSKWSWKAGIAQRLLAIRVTRRLHLEGSDQIWDHLAAVAFGFYQGAKEAIEGVKLT